MPSRQIMLHYYHAYSRSIVNTVDYICIEIGNVVSDQKLEGSLVF